MSNRPHPPRAIAIVLQQEVEGKSINIFSIHTFNIYLSTAIF